MPRKTPLPPSIRVKGIPNTDKILQNFLIASSIREGEIDDELAEAWMNANPAYSQTVKAWLDGVEDVELPQTLGHLEQSDHLVCAIRTGWSHSMSTV